MTTGFADHFSRDSQAYAKFRPRYPEPLFHWVAALPLRHRLVWDAGTGNGQAASMLSGHFEQVVASDPSIPQVKAAESTPRVHYFTGAAEASAIRAGSVDLVTVAQAFHWLDHPRLYEEVNRIIAPGGAFAAWCYATLIAGQEIDALITPFYSETIGPYWPPERAHVDRAYQHFEIPIDEVNMPTLAIEGALTLPAFVGYIRTWSGVARFIAARGYDPVVELAGRLAAIWGDPDALQSITWPIAMRAGRWSG